MRHRVWKEEPCDPAAAAALAVRLGIDPVVGAVLCQRGLSDPAAAESFLYGKTPEFHSPFLMPDMEPAVERLLVARRRRERLLVHGDYDVDGISGTALLYDLLRRNGWSVSAHVPHRTEEGYGISSARLQEAFAEGVTLLVTVDCGTSAVEEVAEAAQHGMDVVITDHHRPPERLPAAHAHVNPHLAGSAYPFPELSGAGVAYKLALALAERGAVPPEEAARQLDLVALGTIADMMPLLGENRDLVRAGLAAFAHRHRPGLSALAETCKLSPAGLSSEEIAFQIAPRLNAAGRLADPRLAFDLLTSTSGEEALDLVQEVERLNQERRAREQEILKEAYAMLNEDTELAQRESVLLAHRDWHRGVVGLVASRLAESLHRPVAVLSIDGETATGSARAACGVDVTEALSRCASLLDRYGGHAAAAGFQLPAARIPELRDAFELAVAASSAADLEPLAGLPIAMRLSPAQITRRLVSDLALLEPYGEAHARPVFALCGVDLRSRAQVVGNGHLKLYVPPGTLPEQPERLDMIGWNKGGLVDQIRWGDVDVAFELGLNHYRGETRVQCKLVDLRDHDAGEPPTPARPMEVVRGGLRLWDYRPLPRLRRALCRFLNAGSPVTLISQGRSSRWLAQVLERLPEAPLEIAWDSLAALPGAGLGARLAVLAPPENEAPLRQLGRLLPPECEVHLFWTRSVLDACEAMLASLCPERREMAVMYRALASQAGRVLPAAEWQALLEREGRSSAHAELAVRCFVELGLLVERDAGLGLAQSPPRRELTQSDSYHGLLERQSAALAWLERLRRLTSAELLELLHAG